MNNYMIVIIGVLGCMCAFAAGYVVGVTYTVEALKTKGEKK